MKAASLLVSAACGN